jgi:hypothetical protein
MSDTKVSTKPMSDQFDYDALAAEYGAADEQFSADEILAILGDEDHEPYGDVLAACGLELEDAPPEHQTVDPDDPSATETLDALDAMSPAERVKLLAEAREDGTLSMNNRDDRLAMANQVAEDAIANANAEDKPPSEFRRYMAQKLRGE